MRNHHSEQNQFQCIYGRLTFVLRRDLRNHKPVPKGWFCCVHRSNMTDACWINMRYSVLSSDEAHCVTVVVVKPAGKSLNATCLQCERPVGWTRRHVCSKDVRLDSEREDLCFQTELKHLILSEPSQSVDTPSSSSSFSDRSSVSPAHSNLLLSGAPLEDFRCLSALPEGTWTVDVPYLSVLWSRDSNQQLYAHLSSHVVVSPWCWFGFTLEVTQKQRVRYFLRLKTEKRQNDEASLKHFFIWNLNCSVLHQKSGDAAR